MLISEERPADPSLLISEEKPADPSLPISEVGGPADPSLLISEEKPGIEAVDDSDSSDSEVDDGAKDQSPSVILRQEGETQ